jgi:uncharacterized protein (DUF58 family)
MRSTLGVLGAGALALVSAWLFDTASLFLVGIALVLLAAAALAIVFSASRQVSVQRSPLVDRAVEDEAVPTTIELRLGFLGAPGGRLIDPLGGTSVLVADSSLPPRRPRLLRIEASASFARRGQRLIDPPALELTDPFGLVSFLKRGSGAPQRLLVLPRTERVRWAAKHRGGHLDVPPRAAAADPLSAGELDGIQPYRTGTPGSRIHWPALARGAGLMERRLHSDDDERPLIVLDPRDDGSLERLDVAVRAAASLILELARRGGCRVRLGGERRSTLIGSDLAAWPAVHARLATVSGAGQARAPVLSTETLRGGLLYVSAHCPPRLPPTGRGAAPTLLVLPADIETPAGGRPCLEVAGCRGYLLRGRARSVAA